MSEQKKNNEGAELPADNKTSKKKTYVKPRVHSRPAYEKLALASCATSPETIPQPFGDCLPS
ncbi:MAG: hypothetical protein CMH54_01185 [Myxococcales bacterium]|nr:hypothetical protein [Myxococcales bacterium]